MTIKTTGPLEGYGLTFTCGRGTEIVQQAAKVLSRLVTGRRLRDDIYTRFGQFWREITSETQLRWVTSVFLAQFIVILGTDFALICVVSTTRKNKYFWVL